MLLVGYVHVTSDRVIVHRAVFSAADEDELKDLVRADIYRVDPALARSDVGHSPLGNGEVLRPTLDRDSDKLLTCRVKDGHPGCIRDPNLVAVVPGCA